MCDTVRVSESVQKNKRGIESVSETERVIESVCETERECESVCETERVNESVQKNVKRARETGRDREESKRDTEMKQKRKQSLYGRDRA